MNLNSKTSNILSKLGAYAAAIPRTGRIFGVATLCALLAAGSVSYFHRQQRRSLSSAGMLSALWNEYKLEMLDPVTKRTLDKQQANITTSEGQSYTMLRAVWQNDQPTFDVSWKWTQDNLKRPTDSLPAWLWGERADGTYGILTDRNGQNTASDADTDLALSLVYAGNRWHNPAYTDTATTMIADIWKQDVVIIQGKPVLTADNQEQTNPTQVIVNPSYFAPYAYTVFAKLDPNHDWLGLRGNMYALLDQASALALNAPRSANIPPDWISVNRQNGAITPDLSSGQTTHYSYDAMRVPFRLALDYQWNGAPEAKSLLSHYGFFAQQWNSTGKILAAYDHQGMPVRPEQESPAIYGATLGYFVVENPHVATQIYEAKLRPLYDATTGTWAKSTGYYDSNWAWFGMALYLGQLPNLALLPN